MDVHNLTYILSAFGIGMGVMYLLYGKGAIELQKIKTDFAALENYVKTLESKIVSKFNGGQTL